VAAHCPRRQAAWAGIAAGAALAWPLWTATAGIAPLIARVQIAVVSLVLPALGWLSGDYMSELRGRAARSRREQELETGRAVAEEQARVGRELHDVIAHTLSVIIMQAGAAEDVFGTRPQSPAAPPRSARGGPQRWPSLPGAGAVRPSPARRRTVAPPPGLSGWASCWPRSGRHLTVTARVDGAPADLPAGDSAAYWIVQEADERLARPGAGGQSASATARPGCFLRSLMTASPRRNWAARARPGTGPIGNRERAKLHGRTTRPGRARRRPRRSGSASRWMPPAGRDRRVGTHRPPR
jgi:hypothetical protein